jgi:DNA phosphorothioation-associated putative methyltransferase
MRRTTWSRPVALALEHEVLRRGCTVLDYGCGHGDDFLSLRALGFDAEGWDPHHRPDGRRKQSDIVHLGYVLNVIENPSERREALLHAYRLARSTLIVAVRVDRSLKDAEAFADGVLTKRRTFQKLYSQAEFREYLGQTLRVDPLMADLGVAYVFKAEDEKARYLAARTFGRRLAFQHDLHQRFASDSLAQDLVRRATELGRLPHEDEFFGWTDLAARFGGIARVGRLALANINAEAFAGSLAQRAEDILTYLAKLRFTGMRIPKASLLPAEIGRDIRSIFGSLKSAQDESLVLLFAMGQVREVRAAMNTSPVGKLVGDALYVHHSAVDTLPPVLRLLDFTARKIVGEVDADVVKFADDGRAVSFLRYPDFDDNPHPELRSSIRVYLPRSSYEVREYGPANPFILHRKELLVADDHPLRETFATLTATEAEAGLLGGTDIGTKRAWEERLAESGWSLDGHHLAKHGRRVGSSSPSAYDAAMPGQDAQPLATFVREIESLKVHRADGRPSLKKPLLLLLVLQKLRTKELTENKLRFSALEADFSALYRQHVGRSTSLAEPFFRLGTEPFWTIALKGGWPATGSPPPKSVLAAPESWAALRPELWSLLTRSPDAVETAISTVKKVWLAER